MDIILDRNLQKFRRKKGNTQEELAAFLCVSSQAVSKWERGESMPDVCQLPRIAAYYNVTVDDLLGVGEIRKKERVEAYNITKNHTVSERELLLKHFGGEGLDDPSFDCWRDKDWFQAVAAGLRKSYK